MSENKQYENEYKVQAVKLAKKIGAVNAANELQISVNTLYGWIRKARIGSLDIGCGERSPEESLNIAEKIRFYCKAMEVSRHFTVILNVRTPHGSISRLLTLC